MDGGSHSFPLLFTPLSIRGISLRNRIVMPAMNTNLAEPDGSVSERFTRYFVERGKGGVGLIVVSPGYIDPTARKRGGSLLYHDDRFVPGLKRLAASIRSTGAKVFQQLNHNGRLVSSSKELKTAVTKGAVGPSAVAHRLTGEIPHVLTVDEIEQLIEAFGQAARRAYEAGFDGVELHGTQGYLINQFFSVYSNRRTDAWGGSLENRMRFALRIHRRVRELTGSGFLVGYRVNARELAPIETPVEDVVALCERLEQEGIDLLSVAVGNSETPATLFQRAFLDATSDSYRGLLAALRARVKVPLIAVGGITTPAMAERVLEERNADLVATGKALIADPHWPHKARRGEIDRIRCCTGCYQGCMERLAQEKQVTCLYNPEVGREGELRPSSRRKKVWVIGGGPGGMQAALASAARGHEVELFEQESTLGGEARRAAMTPGKEAFTEVTRYLENELKLQGVPVRLGTRITANDVLRAKPHCVIVATGAVPLVPDIAGIERANVVTARDALNGKALGARVVVASRGYTGAEIALFLAARGKAVVLLEALDDIAADIGPINRTRLKEALKRNGVDARCGAELLRVAEDSVSVRARDAEFDLPVDTVVLALGTAPRGSLLRELEGQIDELYGVGDCVEPRGMMQAVQDGYGAALKI